MAGEFIKHAPYLFPNGIAFKEMNTPAALADWGKLYTKSDNVLYFQDGAGNEHAITLIGDVYGEAFIYDNAVTTTIETADTPIALDGAIETGLVQGFTFESGSTAAITVYANYDGTVAGTILATSTHGLTTGDIITIRGTTNYNGIFQITVVDSTHFYFTDTWVNDNGASDFDQGARLIAGAGAAGKYSATWQMSTAPSAACTLIWKMNVNVTPQNKSTAEQKYSINDLTTCSSSCALIIADGDVIWLSVQSDAANDITNKHGEFNLHRL